MALALAEEVGEARQGYPELQDEDDGSGAPWWSMAHCLLAKELESMLAVIARGIIAEALATGRMIVTPSPLCK